MVEETEKSILIRIRSTGEFNHSMKDDLARLFHTPDPMTGLERTTDYWLQLPEYWIRMVHTKRTYLVHPDDEPSPIASSNPSAFGICCLLIGIFTSLSHSFLIPMELRLLIIGVIFSLQMALNKVLMKIPEERFLSSLERIHCVWISSNSA